jgi:hypothetical protein
MGCASPGTWLLDYVGPVTLGEDQDKSSNYLCNLGNRGKLACDAFEYGNELHFINNFHNTGQYPNAKFNIHCNLRGELRQGVYVKLANGSRDFGGVERDKELLVSYGKGYWRGRIGN